MRYSKAQVTTMKADPMYLCIKRSHEEQQVQQAQDDLDGTVKFGTLEAYQSYQRSVALNS